MNIRLLALLLILAPVAYSRPAVELVPYAQFNVLLRAWRKATNPPEPLIVQGTDLKPINLPGDVLLWERYTGQPLTKGDLFIFRYHGQDTCREIGAISSTSVRTLANTEVKLSDVEGIVRRVVRLHD